MVASMGSLASSMVLFVLGPSGGQLVAATANHGVIERRGRAGGAQDGVVEALEDAAWCSAS